MAPESKYHFSDEDGDYIGECDLNGGLEDLSRCVLPIIEEHSKSIEAKSDNYHKILKILQKESGPRFSVMKEDMKEGDSGKSYSYKTHVEKHIRKL